jgi:hypothetical protein
MIYIYFIAAFMGGFFVHKVLIEKNKKDDLIYEQINEKDRIIY